MPTMSTWCFYACTRCASYWWRRPRRLIVNWRNVRDTSSSSPQTPIRPRWNTQSDDNLPWLLASLMLWLSFQSKEHSTATLKHNSRRGGKKTCVKLCPGGRTANIATCWAPSLDLRRTSAVTHKSSNAFLESMRLATSRSRSDLMRAWCSVQTLEIITIRN